MGDDFPRFVRIAVASAFVVVIGLVAAPAVFAQQRAAPADLPAQMQAAPVGGLRLAATGGDLGLAQAKVAELKEKVQAAQAAGEGEEVDRLTEELADALKAFLTAGRKARLDRLSEAADAAEKAVLEASAPVTLPTVVSPEANRLKSAIEQSLVERENYLLKGLQAQYERARQAEEAAKLSADETAKVTTVPSATEFVSKIIVRRAQVTYEEPPTICVVWEPGDCSPRN